MVDDFNKYLKNKAENYFDNLKYSSVCKYLLLFSMSAAIHSGYKANQSSTNLNKLDNILNSYKSNPILKLDSLNKLILSSQDVYLSADSVLFKNTRMSKINFNGYNLASIVYSRSKELDFRIKNDVHVQKIKQEIENLEMHKLEELERFDDKSKLFVVYSLLAVGFLYFSEMFKDKGDSDFIKKDLKNTW